MQVLGNEIVAMEGKYIARKGTENFFRRCTLLAGETEADFVEVDTLPDEGLKAAKEAKKAEIEAYDKSSAVNEFFLGGKPMWVPRETRVSLANSIDIEQAAGKSETSLWFAGSRYTLPISQAKQILAALELYALECYNKTQEHIAAVDALTSVAEVESYDYKTGYPQKLSL